MVLWQLLGVNITPSYFQFHRKFLNVMGKRKKPNYGDAVLRQNVARPEKRMEAGREEGRKERSGEGKEGQRNAKEGGRGRSG